jgi:hypothetical protein
LSDFATTFLVSVLEYGIATPPCTFPTGLYLISACLWYFPGHIEPASPGRRTRALQGQRLCGGHSVRSRQLISQTRPPATPTASLPALCVVFHLSRPINT